MSEPKVIGALRQMVAQERELAEWVTGHGAEGAAAHAETAVLLDSLAEALAAAAPSLRYAACTDSLPAADRASVRRLASLLTTEED